jgi:aminopeptidase N
MSGPLTYRGGALVLNLLRVELGEVPFWRGLQRFTREAAGGSVTSADLRQALERESGRDLGPFFANWVYGAAPPQLVARAHREGNDLAVVVDQLQQPAWPIQLSVAVETSKGRVVRRRLLAKPREELHFDVGAAPIWSIRVDDGGALPVAVRHDRPVTMLLYQLAHEPDVVGRAEAFDLLERACAGAPTDADCSARADVMSSREPHEPSRLLRVAEHDALQPGAAP